MSGYKNTREALEATLNKLQEAEEGSEEWLFHKGNKLCFEMILQGVTEAAAADSLLL